MSPPGSEAGTLAKSPRGVRHPESHSRPDGLTGCRKLEIALAATTSERVRAARPPSIEFNPVDIHLTDRGYGRHQRRQRLARLSPEAELLN